MNWSPNSQNAFLKLSKKHIIMEGTVPGIANEPTSRGGYREGVSREGGIGGG